MENISENSGNGLVDTVGPAWTTDRTMEQLRVSSREELETLVKEGKLLSLPTRDDSVVYPIFQFVKREGIIIVKPGLRLMFEMMLDMDQWEVAMLLNIPAPELSGMSPVEWEKNGYNLKRLHDVARTMSQESKRF